MDYKGIDKRISKHYSERGLFRKEICLAIHDMLDELGGELQVTDGEHEDDYIGICYDGGNHAECDSTMNSSLESVCSTTAKDPFTNEEYETFYADCEDESGVEEYRLMFDDVTSIFYFVLARYKCAKGIE